MRQSGVRLFSKIGVGALCATIVGGGAWAVVNELADRPVDCTVTEAPTFSEAQEIAGECGHDVGVLDTYEPQMRQVATPNNTAVAEFSAGAVRTDITGEWEEIDPTLVVDPATGEVKVASPLYDITLDPHGEDAFMRIADDGEAVSVKVPFELGAPVLDGSTAAWPVLGTAGAVIEGAVLKARVHADASGVTPVLEVRDREAYAQLSEAAGDADISFEIQSAGGLELEADPITGGFAAVGSDGERTFVGGEALQWDSAGVGEAAPVEAPTDTAEPDGKTAEEIEAAEVEEVVLGELADAIPVAGDAVAPLEVDVDGPDMITLVADEAMVEDPETVWPIAIDPPLSGVTLNDWTALTTAGWQHYNDDTDEGVGFCDVSKAASCGKDFKSRLFWDFTGMDLLKSLDENDIKAATFSAYGTHSYDCSGYLLRVRLADAGINSKTTWSTQPDVGPVLSTAGPKHRDGQCGQPSRVSWDVKDGVKERAGSASSVSLRMSAATETSMSSWRRYKMHTAQLTVEYNRRPAVPTKLILQDGAVTRGCTTGSGAPFVTSTNRPTLTAVATDPDKKKVKVTFQLYAGSTNLWEVETGFDESGSKFSRTVPAADALKSGTDYRWRARSTDQDEHALSSAWSGWCEFTFDNVHPGAPTIEPLRVGTGFDAIYEKNLERGGKGLRGCFVISRAASDSDVSKVTYTSLDGKDSPTPVALTNGKVTVCHSAGAPLTTGPQELTAFSTDAAGNTSGSAVYKYDVAVAREDGVWSFDGRSATVPDETKKDTGEANPAGPLTVTAGSWANGPHLDFASRDGDYALNLNGTSTFGATKAPVFDTTSSFVVSAHVMLGATDGTRTILSQDGVTSSAWSLRFQTTGCPAGTGAGCWAFSTFGKTGAVSKMVLSKEPVKTSSWVHLTAEYDKRENTLRLWSCDVGTPAAPAPGVPKLEQATGVPAMWQAPGPFVVGRGLTSGTGGDWFKGRIDNVRIFKGEVVADSKVRRMCQGAEARDFSDGIDGLDPTMAVK